MTKRPRTRQRAYESTACINRYMALYQCTLTGQLSFRQVPGVFHLLTPAHAKIDIPLSTAQSPTMRRVNYAPGKPCPSNGI